MRVAVMTAPGEVQVEDRADPTIQKPTDAIIRLSATSICGSGLWHYGGIETLDGPRPMGHKDADIVEEVPGHLRLARHWLVRRCCGRGGIRPEAAAR